VTPLIAVLDYGIGNLRSAEKALVHVGADARLTADPALVRDAGAVVLPGVGAFGRCLDALRRARLEDVALEAVASGQPFLGICIGMQMLFDASDEDERVRGLGVLPGRVQWIPPGVKRPQIQWNRLEIRQPRDPLLAGLGPEPWCYFVHSLHGVPTDAGDVVATCEYGTTLNAAFRRGSVFATQFHPEKSGAAGLQLLANFARLASGVLTG
jgi:glutamine amidotransferase